MLVSKEQIDQSAVALGLLPIAVECFSAIETGWVSESPKYEPKWAYFFHPEVFSKKLGITLDTEVQLQKFSWGPVQIMGSVARELGYEDHLPKLIYPELGLHFGGLQIQRMMKRYGLTTDAIAAYNAGSPRRDDDGQYVNQNYVDRFVSEWKSRGGTITDGSTTLVAPA